MNTKGLFQLMSIVGAVALAIAIFTLRSQFASGPSTPAQPPAASVSEPAPVPEDHSARYQEQIAKLQADNEKLLVKLQTVTASNQALTEALAQKSQAKPKSDANPLAALFGGGSDGETNGMASAMQQLMKSQLEQQTEGKISRMKARLQLTPDQEQKIREALNAANKQAMAMAQKMYSGEAKPEELKEISSSDATGSHAINEILTPEQRTEYEAMQKEELQNNARLIANAEMLQLQNSLGLTQEQQDKVFAALYQQTVDTASGASANPVVPTTTDPTAALQQALDRKVEALTPILTPEQLKSYRDLQEQQLKMIQAFIPKASTPASPTPVIIQKP